MALFIMTGVLFCQNNHDRVLINLSKDIVDILVVSFSRGFIFYGCAPSLVWSFSALPQHRIELIRRQIK